MSDFRNLLYKFFKTVKQATDLDKKAHYAP